jgi:hypothetical protein
MRTVGVNIGLVLACSFLIVGCATVVAPLEPQLVSERLPFIQDGKTSKEEVLSRLGEPANRYEGGRILTYEMCPDFYLKGPLRLRDTRPTDKTGQALPGAARCSLDRINNLILVFGPDDLVERHSVVLMNLVKRGSVELWR